MVKAKARRSRPFTLSTDLHSKKPQVMGKISGAIASGRYEQQVESDASRPDQAAALT